MARQGHDDEGAGPAGMATAEARARVAPGVACGDWSLDRSEEWSQD